VERVWRIEPHGGLQDCARRVIRGPDLREVRYCPWFTGANGQRANSTPRVVAREYSSPFAVSSMAKTGRGACSFVHPISDPRLTAAKQQTTLNTRSGQHDEEGSTQFTSRL
jgi:hypothetical protein